MAQSLLAEFMAGVDARCNGSDSTACPHYATSNSADAWLAGYAHAGYEKSGQIAGLLATKVWHGRGYAVNVTGELESGATHTMQYVVNYNSAHNLSGRVTVSKGLLRRNQEIAA